MQIRIVETPLNLLQGGENLDQASLVRMLQNPALDLSPIGNPKLDPARIYWSGGYVLEDLGSANGVYFFGLVRAWMRARAPSQSGSKGLPGWSRSMTSGA